MPSLATHYLFGQDVFKQLNFLGKDMICKAKGAFRLGLQGPDIFFYDFFHNIFTDKKYIGSNMHTRHTDAFFSNCLDYIKENRLSDDPVAHAYFYGLICHYSLDCAAHPYIYYFTGSKDKSSTETKKSLARHFQFEADIDHLLYYDRTGKCICDVRRSLFMKISSEEISKISPMLAYAISKTYAVRLTPSYIKKMIRRAIRLNSMMHSTFGFLKPAVKFLERLLLGQHIGCNMIFTRKLPKRTCLNENNETWHFYWNNEECRSSFMNLYKEGVAFAADLIQTAGKTISGMTDISNFIAKSGGKSYHSGIDWHFDDIGKYYSAVLYAS